MKSLPKRVCIQRHKNKARVHCVTKEKRHYALRAKKSSIAFPKRHEQYVTLSYLRALRELNGINVVDNLSDIRADKSVDEHSDEPYVMRRLTKRNPRDRDSSRDADGSTDPSADAEGSTDRGSNAPPVVYKPGTKDRYDIAGIRYEYDVDGTKYYWVLWTSVEPGDALGGWVEADDVSVTSIADWTRLQEQ